ncbi:hypothetical protein [Agrobacterium tumefaciens]|uniref:hypothetical protein n=1 Tax=Agrobacterium tumefaciens TaxID=358 RepID=UPI0015739E78|nr:hypothetical protein [Agrobacterium tumefaciens]NTB05850.1 hypothetical protein [Agrobacterium tumefaciens]
MKKFYGEVVMADLDKPYRAEGRKEYPEVEAADEAEARQKLSWSYMYTGVVKQVWEM